MKWIKPCDGGHCIEAGASLEGEPGVFLRSTLRPEERIFATADEWRVFVAGVKSGDFDHVGCAHAEPTEKPFEAELSSLLNRYSAENVSGTPDFVLAQYLVGVLKIYNEAVSRRAEWRGELTEFRPSDRNGGIDGNTV